MLAVVVVAATVLIGSPVGAGEDSFGWEPPSGPADAGRDAVEHGENGADGGVSAQIVGGGAASENERPWIAALTAPTAVEPDPFFGQFCTGVLIAPRVVATTGFCVTNDDGIVLPSNAGARALFDQVTLQTPLTGSGHTINGVSRHPRYDRASVDINDLALLRLSTAVPGSRATPLPFARPDDVESYPAATSAGMAGWGSTDPSPDSSSDYPRTMREATAPVVSDAACDAAYAGPAIGDATNVCVGGGGVGACVFDEGGPLTIEGDSLLVGLYSFGPFDIGEDCGTTVPDVHVELAGYEDFLDAHIADTNAAVFSDVRFGHPFLTEIWAMKEADILGGFEDGSYRPGNAVSRQAMSAFLYRLAGEPVGPFPDPGFPDVGPTNPFVLEISWMADAGITGGFEDGGFHPSAAVSRGAMSAFMYRFAEEPAGPFQNPGFADVGPSHPFYDEIAWMAESGITTGFSNNTFRPAAAVSRQSMAAFLYRLDLILQT